MVDPEKAKALVAELQQKSEAKKIQWEPTANQDEFVATFRGQVTFTISKYEDPNYNGDSYRLVMRDSEGREMLSFAHHSSWSGGEKFPQLLQLYQEAHDSALKVDETIDSILDNLREAR
jgi:hypothetical protein